MYFKVSMAVVAILVSLLPQSSTSTTQKKTQNKAYLRITGATASATGLVLEIKGDNINVLAVKVDQTGSQSPVAVVDWFSVAPANIPSQLRNDSGPTSASVNLPILVADSNTKYTIGAWAKSAQDDNMDWTDEETETFNGFEVTKTQVPDLKLTFTSETLNLSVSSGSSIETLAAQWQIGAHTTDIVKTTSQDPSVSLRLADLTTSGSPSALPSLVFSVEDSKTHQTYETHLAISVVVDQNLGTKVQQAKAASSSSGGNKSTKTNFTWSDLAKSGLGAVAKYFLTVL